MTDNTLAQRFQATRIGDIKMAQRVVMACGRADISNPDLPAR